MSLRLLLLQTRHAHDPMRAHERECFAARLEVDPEDIEVHDALQGPPTMRQVRRSDALLMGGSGDFLVSHRNQPNLDPLLDLLREVVSVGHPTFATCYGYQAMVEAMGGEVIHDPERIEVGTFELQLTDEGRSDPLFCGLPPRFLAQQGHKDRAARLPHDLFNLASSERCPFQALSVPGKPVWAVQFHPELDRDANRTRYQHYLEEYSPELTPEEVEQALELFDHTPEASSLLRRFIHLVFGD